MAPEQATPGLTMLCFIVLHTYFFFFFKQIEGLWQPSVKTIFPTAFVHFVSHFGNSCIISKIFIIIIFVMVVWDH